MKFFKQLTVCILGILFIGCINDEFIEIENQENNIEFYSRTQIDNVPNYSMDELIIQYHDGTTEAEKQTLRLLYEILSFEVCNNCDGTIEKWLFDPSVDIENKKLSISDGGEGGGGPEEIVKNVDNEFIFNMERERSRLPSVSENNNYTDKIVVNNIGVTIGVLDSGLDFNNPMFEDPFLYNYVDSEFSDLTSGWNFVDHNNRFKDTFDLNHGTKVTSIIHKRLKESSTPFQILPIKVCDDSGRASYFDILCGLDFAMSRVNIMQISLGWYDNNTVINTIMLDIFTEYENKVLIVTSAGNSGENTDEITHYPSGYENTNILSIAAINTDFTDAAGFTNFGELTVDFFAPGENIKFVDARNQSSFMSGTSYAAPFVTAAAARELYVSGMNLTPSGIIDALESNARDVSFRKQVKYNAMIK